MAMSKTSILQIWVFKSYRLEIKKKKKVTRMLSNVLKYIRGPVLSLI